MADVVVGLVPAVVAAGYYFRIYALFLIATCVVSAVLTEWLCNLIRKRPNSLGDLSAVVTGVILALSLPPRLPIWAAIAGSAVAVAIGKMVYGGLGCNIFNPAMVGRAFLTVSFGMMMTTWTVPATVGFLFSVEHKHQSDLDCGIISEDLGREFAENNASLSQDATVSVEKPGDDWLIADGHKKYYIRKGWLRLSVYNLNPKMSKIAPQNSIEFRTQATPLAWSKTAIKNKLGADTYSEEQFMATVTGEVGGCLGETCTIALVIGGLYLLIRGTISFHIPLAVLLSAFVFSSIAYLIDSDAYVQPLFHLTSGGLLLGAFFIATDPVTAPLTRRGMWIFGVGVGAITMLIRIVGKYPEGVMFSVLVMNAITPLIDRLCKRVPAGGKPSA
jgi:electron transport complex protein RnfD